jgi:hypothetical protein
MISKSELEAKRGIFQGFRRSLSALIGESAAQAFIANLRISENKFDPAIDREDFHRPKNLSFC